MFNIGIISEGDTDFVTLQNILVGYFDKDITGYINQLQPKRGQMGGWSRVFNYCSSVNFKNDFVDNDFMVIQVDTDKSFELPFDVSHSENDIALTVEQLVVNVKQRFEKLLMDSFGIVFWEEFQHRILFAISVHSTECWFLPLFEKSIETKSETHDCYNKLSKIVKKQDKSVKVFEKTYKFYDSLSDDFCFPKKLEKAASANPSFKIFIENELKTKIPLQNA